MTFWKRLERKTLYSSDWIEITLDKIELPDNRVIDNFELMHYPHTAAGVVAVNKEGEILLVRAYRYLHESFDWEIPGGVIEVDEKIIDGVKRELLEETGYAAEHWTPLIKFYPHKATCNQMYHIYIAEGLTKKTDDFMKVEISEMKFHTIDEIRRMVRDGEINDSLSLVALQKYIIRTFL